MKQERKGEDEEDGMYATGGAGAGGRGIRKDDR